MKTPLSLRWTFETPLILKGFFENAAFTEVDFRKRRFHWGGLSKTPLSLRWNFEKAAFTEVDFRTCRFHWGGISKTALSLRWTFENAKGAFAKGAFAKGAFAKGASARVRFRERCFRESALSRKALSRKAPRSFDPFPLSLSPQRGRRSVGVSAGWLRGQRRQARQTFGQLLAKISFFPNFWSSLSIVKHR